MTDKRKGEGREAESGVSASAVVKHRCLRKRCRRETEPLGDDGVTQDQDGTGVNPKQKDARNGSSVVS